MTSEMDTSKRWRPQTKLSAMLLLMALVGVSTAWFMTELETRQLRREATRLNSELQAQRKLLESLQLQSWEPLATDAPADSEMLLRVRIPWEWRIDWARPGDQVDVLLHHGGRDRVVVRRVRLAKIRQLLPSYDFWLEVDPSQRSALKEACALVEEGGRLHCFLHTPE